MEKQGLRVSSWEFRLHRQRRFPDTLGIITGDKNVLCVLFMGEAEGAAHGAFPPFSLEIGLGKNFVVKSRPSKEVDFRKTLCRPDTLPKFIVFMIRCVSKKMVADSRGILAQSVSPTSGIFDMGRCGEFTF